MAISAPVCDEGRIDAALEAVAGIGIDPELAAGRRGAHRIEIGRLEEDVRRLGGAAGLLAADDAGDADCGPSSSAITVIVGIERIGPAVERLDGLAVAREAGVDVAPDLVGVEDMQRPGVGDR